MKNGIKYQVIYPFTDLKDRTKSSPYGKVYAIGDDYFNEDVKRIKELSTKNNKINRILIVEVKEPQKKEVKEVEKPRKPKKWH